MFVGSSTLRFGAAFPWLLRHTLVLFLAGATAVQAQDSAPPPIEGGPGSGIDVPTLERLESWLAAVQGANLPEEKKAEPKAINEQARRFLADAEASRKRRAELDALREAAPRRLQEVLDELAKPPADATPLPPEGASLTQLEQLAAAAQAEKAAAEKAVKDLEEEKKRRAEDRQRNPERVANARKRIEEIEKELERLHNVPEDPLDASFAKRRALLAEREYLQRRLEESVG